MKFNFPKLSTNSFKKIAVIATCTVAAVVPLTLLTINWNNLSILYAAGSSAVAPVMEKLTSVFYDFDQPRKIDITIAATGSGNGLESAVQNTKNFGNVSWGPDKSKIVDTPTLAAKTAWETNKIKTFTFGIDGIGVIYKAPTDVKLNINQNNIKDFYSAITGINAYTYGDLIKKADANAGGDESEGANSQLVVRPYARAGGAAKSGTTDAFLKDSGFKVDKKEAYYKALEVGNYGNNVESTKESNVETWKQISSGSDQGAQGAITYLSAGFILNNRAEIENAGFQIATYGDNQTPLELANITNKTYKWYRPLNTLVSLAFNQSGSPARQWIEWLYDNYHDARITNALGEVGIVPLTKTQLESMTKDGNLWVSDFELRAYGDDPDDKYKWGAQL